jgi:hypothetical protein
MVMYFITGEYQDVFKMVESCKSESQSRRVYVELRELLKGVLYVVTNYLSSSFLATNFQPTRVSG